MKLLAPVVVSLGVGLLGAPASATSVSSPGLLSALPNASAAQTVQYGPRRCWRRYDGALVCRHVVRRYYRDGYYDPYYYGYGPGYYGYRRGYGYYDGPGVGIYGPGVGFRFGF